MSKKSILLIMFFIFSFGFTTLSVYSSEGYKPYTKVYDEQTDVICYYFNHYGYLSQSGGISCIPRNQTPLSKQEALKLNN